ncbi:MAG: DUF3794 domain-containing protein [bacterium]|nr:DUF3794 domain-containing protein [bacterium]
MELIKKNIHMNKLKCRCNTQLTLDDDFNVPDVKPDIERIVKEQGIITLTEVKPLNGKLIIKGELNFTLLYVSEDSEKPIHNIVGKLPFEETINMDDATSDNNVNVKCEIEDLSTSLINSRKLNVKSVVSFNCMAEDIYDEETAVGVEDCEDAQYLNKKLDITQLVINKKDTYRVKDEVMLPSGKPNVFEVLYNEIDLRNIDTRLADNKINIKGDMLLFVLYSADDEEQPIQYYETELPFNGTLDCSGSNENMISDIGIHILSKNLEVKADTDGEERVLDMEVVLDLDIKAYQEEVVDLLCDVYSVSKHMVPEYEETYFENIIMKNNSKARIVDHVLIDTSAPSALQICNANGSIKMDDTQIVPGGIQVDGVIYVQLLYITDDDTKPLGCAKGIIPFSQVVEVKNIKEGCLYSITPGIEQLSVVMLDSNDIEVKASINLDAIVFDRIKQMIIRNVMEEDIDTNLLQQMPSMTGYVVKTGDTLWTIAKEYYTTVDSIMEMNALESDQIKEGDHLLLIKKVDAIC